MCDTCGCGEVESVHQHDHKHDHHHTHPPNHESQGHQDSREIILGKNILIKNDLLAEHNRGYFEGKNILAINLISSPGSGKTSLLEKTILDLGRERPFYIIEGDQQTGLDAERIEKAGAPAIQVNTGNGCHLDARMIHEALKSLKVEQDSFLMIENVGNLICPALFDLGESYRVVIISTTEGDDKPAKYPTVFQSAQLCIINKTDLLPYVDFDLERCKEFALRVNPEIEFLELSAKSGEGLQEWYDWLRKIRPVIQEQGTEGVSEWSR